MGRRPKKTTLAGRHRWVGFRGTAYCLDSEKVCQLPITTQSGQQTTVVNVFEILKEAGSFELDYHNFESPTVGLRVKTTFAEICYEGPQFNLQVLNVLLTLDKIGM